MDVCYKIPSCMQRPRNDDSHLNHAHHGTSEHVFSLLPHKRHYIWNDRSPKRVHMMQCNYAVFTIVISNTGRFILELLEQKIT